MDDLNKLGKYRIQSVLGRGAMGIVYKGFDPNIERTVAIKTIRKETLAKKEMAPLLARFKREAQAAGRLTHPNIVTVYEYGEEDDTAYIAMEFVPGRELKDILDKNERFPLNTVFNIINQLLDALAYSHSQGVIHRDIKPGNILLLGNGQIKVTDFGIARIESSTLTQFGDVIGTPSYMSPEQFAGQQVDNRSDLFSTGVILYHLLTGEKPFPGNSMTTIMHRVINTDPPLVSALNVQVSAFLDALLVKALAKNPGQRFQTAAEFKSALAKVFQNDRNAAAVAHNADATRMSNGSAEITENIPSDEITNALQQAAATGKQGDLQRKFDKIVNLLESQGHAGKESEKKLYATGRMWVLTILVAAVLAIFGYTSWMIYSENLTYEELEQIVKEKAEDLSGSFSGQRPEVVEISQSLKKKPANEFNAFKEDRPALIEPPEQTELSTGTPNFYLMN